MAQSLSKWLKYQKNCYNRRLGFCIYRTGKSFFQKKAKAKVLVLTDEQILSNNIRARKRIEELFSLEKSVEKWLEIYEQ